MRLAGVSLPTRAVAELARRLHDAGHAALAIDVRFYAQMKVPALALPEHEANLVLSVLDEDCPEPLQRLRQALAEQRPQLR